MAAAPVIQWRKNRDKGRVDHLRGEAFRQRQKHAPLYEALVRHAKKKLHPFHVPGHKMGKSFDEEARDLFASILTIDLTEISGMDDLHQPQGVIAEAQALAAEAYGAEETRFLVGGSTAGNIALILAVCNPGDTIIVQRNSHKSVFHGIMLAQANPVFVVPSVDPVTGVAACLRREDVERACQEHPEAKAVFLTNPTYYGMGIDLRKMASVAHRYNMPLVVDEAHGSHYGFHPALPESAMQAGADAAVQSTHKMGNAMTMSSMLHLQGNRLDRNRVSQALAMIQSSSPSYPLMASLDVARRQMALRGQEELELAISRMRLFRERLAEHSWLTTPTIGPESVYSTLDPLKLLLVLQTTHLDGYRLQAEMEARGIFPELADKHHVLLAASTGTSLEDVEQIGKVLQEWTPQQSVRPSSIVQGEGIVASAFCREQVMPMHQAVWSDKRAVPLEEAVGCVAAEMVIPYPPGIPYLVPGERIDEQALTFLRDQRKMGTRFHGVQDPDLRTIQIVT